MGIAIGVATLAIAALLLRSVVAVGDEEVATAIRVSERVPIANAADNVLIRVVGKAKRLDRTVRASLSGRECLYYVVLVEHEVSDGKSTHWETLFTDCDHAPFLLDDGSATAVIDPLGAEVALGWDYGTSTGAMGALRQLVGMAPGNVRAAEAALIEKYKVVAEPFSFRARRFREAIIDDGETIVVCGSGVHGQPAPAGAGEAYRTPATPRLEIKSTDVFKLVISNKPRYVRHK